MTKAMSPDIRGIMGALTSSAGTIVGWTAHIESGLRILSLVVGIIAGIYTIVHYARRNH
jgi:hypothetical protein